MKKRILSFMLTLAMLLSLFPGMAITASAADEPLTLEEVIAIIEPAIKAMMVDYNCTSGPKLNDDLKVTVDEALAPYTERLNGMPVEATWNELEYASYDKEGYAVIRMYVGQAYSEYGHTTKDLSFTFPKKSEHFRAAEAAIIEGLKTKVATPTTTASQVEAWFKEILEAAGFTGFDIGYPEGFSYYEATKTIGGYMNLKYQFDSNAKDMIRFDIPALNFTTDLTSTIGTITAVDTKILTVKAAVGKTEDSAIQYQWYRCADDDKSNPTPIEGATDASFTVPTDTTGRSYYFCRAALGEVTVDSTVTNTYVNPVRFNFSYFGSYSTPLGVPRELTTTATVTVRDGEIAYQWYYCGSTDNKENAVPIEGANSSTYLAPADEEGVHRYFCRAYLVGYEDKYYGDSAVGWLHVYKYYNVTHADPTDEDGYAVAENGKYKISDSSYKKDGYVYIDTEPAEGYAIGNVTVYKTDDPSVIYYSGTDDSFYMPAYDVTVDVTFKKLEPIEKVDFQVDWSRVPSINVGDKLLEKEFNPYYDWAVFVDAVGACNGPTEAMFTIKVNEYNFDALSALIGIPPGAKDAVMGLWLPPEVLWDLDEYTVTDKDELAIGVLAFPYSGYFPINEETGAYKGVVTCNGNTVSENQVMGELLLSFIEVGTVSDLAAKKSAAKTEVFDILYYDELGYTTGGGYGVMPGIAAEGDTINIRVTPDEGYEVDTVTWQPFVMVSDEGDDVNVVTPVDGKYTFTMPKETVMVQVTFKSTAPEPYVITFDVSDLENADAEVLFFTSMTSTDSELGLSTKEELFSYTMRANTDVAAMLIEAKDGYVFEVPPVVTLTVGNVTTTLTGENNFYIIPEFTGNSTIKVIGEAVQPTLKAINIELVQEPTFDGIVDGETLPDLDKLVDMGVLSAEFVVGADSSYANYMRAQWMYAPIGSDRLQEAAFEHVANTAENDYYIEITVANFSSTFLVGEDLAPGNGINIINEDEKSYDVHSFNFLCFEAAESANAFVAVIKPIEEPEEPKTESNVNSESYEKGELIVEGLINEAEAWLDEIEKDPAIDSDDDIKVTVDMTVEVKPSNIVDEAEKEAIEDEASEQSPNLEYLDITIEKTVLINNSKSVENSGPIKETHDLIEIEIPFETSGRSNFKVYRYHGTAVQTLTETPNDDGECIVVGDDKITINAKFFSTYAVGYANGPVFIDYTDSALTDRYWNGTSNLTIGNEATITISNSYTQKATLTISADAEIVAENGTKVTVTDLDAAFVIDNGAEVQMSGVNLERNVANGSILENLIIVDDATLTCVDISVLEDDKGVFEIINNGKLFMEGDKTEIISNSSRDSGRPIFDNVYGTVTIKDGKYTRNGNSGQIIGNGTASGNSTVYIMGGELINSNGTTDTIANGTIIMTDGSITSPNAAAIRSGTLKDEITITGGTIHDSAIAVRLGRDSSANAGEVIIGGDVSFVGNDVDVYLSAKGNVFTLRDDFTGLISVKSGATLVANEKLPITTDGTAQQMRDRVHAADEDQAVNFDNTNEYLYLWEHEHVYDRRVVKNEYLVSSADCENPAVYLLSCECGNGSDNPNDVFKNGSVRSHNFQFKSDANSHWYECSYEDCKKRDGEALHSFTHFDSDGKYHWHECGHVDCTVVSGQEEHDFIHFDSNADIHWYECSDVECTRRVETAHTFRMMSDDNYHWYQCSNPDCNFVNGKEEHTASEWIIDDYAMFGFNGTMHLECTVCERVLITIEIPALIPTRPGNTSYRVDVKSVYGGTILATPNTATAGSTVIVMAKPDAGFELVELIITKANGGTVQYTSIGTNQYTFKMPADHVAVTAVFSEVEEDCAKDFTCPIWSFKDAETTEWYHDGVHYCIENGLMTGLPKNLFDPDGTTTRAQIVTILWRLEGQPLVEIAEGFNDVYDSDWYNNAVRWASANGIVNGYGDSIFGPNDVVTREQMVAILWRYAQYKGFDVSVGENTNILSYGDAFDVAHYAVPAMQWACGSGIVNGMGDGKGGMILDPKGGTTRAQMATMIMRFCVEIEK